MQPTLGDLRFQGVGLVAIQASENATITARCKCAGELGDFIAPGLVARPWCGARNRSPVLDPVPIRFRAPVEKRCKTAAREQFRDAGVVVPPLGVQNCRSPGQGEITQCQKSKRGTVTYSS